MSVEVEAATKIQEMWFMHHYSGELQVLAKLGFWLVGAQKTDFEDIKRLLLKNEAKEAALGLTNKLGAILPPYIRPKGQCNLLGRILLSAYIITLDNSIVKSDNVECAENTEVNQKAKQLVNNLRCLQVLVLLNSTKGIVKELRSLSLVWLQFHNSFMEWRYSNSERAVNELKKYKDGIRQMLLSTGMSKESERIWHRELRKYEEKVDKYYKFFTLGLPKRNTNGNLTQVRNTERNFSGFSISDISNQQLVHEILLNDKISFKPKNTDFRFIVNECSRDLKDGNFGSKSVKTALQIVISNIETLVTLKNSGLLPDVHPCALKVRKLARVTEEKGVGNNVKHNIQTFVPVLQKFVDILGTLGYKCYSASYISEINASSFSDMDILLHVEKCLNDIILNSILCKNDGLNRSLKTIRKLLASEFIQYERREFQKKLNKYSPLSASLPRTFQYMKSSMRSTFLSSEHNLSDDHQLWKIVSSMITSLIFRSEPVFGHLFPETLKFDIRRINYLQVIVQCIATVSSLLTFVKFKYKMSHESLCLLKTQLMVLLTFSETDYFDIDIDSVMDANNIELCISNALLSEASDPSNPSDNTPNVKPLHSEINKIMSRDSPIVKLFLSRLKNTCLKSLYSKTVTPLSSNDHTGARFLYEEISSIFNDVLNIVKCNFDIHCNHYRSLLSEIVCQN